MLGLRFDVAPGCDADDNSPLGILIGIFRLQSFTSTVQRRRNSGSVESFKSIFSTVSSRVFFVLFFRHHMHH